MECLAKPPCGQFIDFGTPGFLIYVAVWFSTVRSEMNKRLAISFLLAPHANNSAISDSRLVNGFALSIMRYPKHLLYHIGQIHFQLPGLLKPLVRHHLLIGLGIRSCFNIQSRHQAFTAFGQVTVSYLRPPPC